MGYSTTKECSENSPITYTMPTRNVPKAPELGTPLYKGPTVEFPMASVIEGFHCIYI